MLNHYKKAQSIQSTAVVSDLKAAISNKTQTITGILICIALLILSGCAATNSARFDNQQYEPFSKPIYQVSKAGNQCAYINQEIVDILEYAKKFNRSQYAYYYQAMSRERLLAVESRAKQADCKFLTMPANTRLHNLASL